MKRVIECQAERRGRVWVVSLPDYGVFGHGRTLKAARESTEQGLALVGEAGEVKLIPTTPELEQLRSIEASHASALGEAVAALALRRATLRDIAAATGVPTARVRRLLAEQAGITNPHRRCVSADDAASGFAGAQALPDGQEPACPPASHSQMAARHPAREDPVPATRRNADSDHSCAHEEKPTGAPGRTKSGQGPAALVTLAEELGLTEADVDELVHDMEHRGAADVYNNGSRPDLVDGDAFDAAHDDAEERASAINNRGLSGQVASLVAAFGAQEAERLLRDAAISACG